MSFFDQFDQAQYLEHEGYKIPVQLTPPDQIEDFSKLLFPFPVTPIEVTGSERVAFLNGLGPTDLRQFEPGQGTRCLFTDSHGHVIFDTYVYAEPEAVLIFCEPGEETKLIKHLDFYAITEDVAFKLAESPVELAILFGYEGNGDEMAAKVIYQGRGGHALLFGKPGLFERLQSKGFAPIGMALYEEIRPLYGIARAGMDYGAHQLPQESALEEFMEFQKGCYLGQEPISRVNFRGKVRNRLEQVLTAQPLEPNQPLVAGDKEVGKVTTPSRLQTGQGFWSLAYVDARLAEQPGVEIKAGAELVQVPRLMALWAEKKD